MVSVDAVTAAVTSTGLTCRIANDRMDKHSRICIFLLLLNTRNTWFLSYIVDRQNDDYWYIQYDMSSKMPMKSLSYRQLLSFL